MDRRLLPSPRSTSGFSLLEVIVAVAAAVILASMLSPMVLTWINDSRIARAHADALMIAAGMNGFFQDTKKWPGQVEILAAPTTRFLSVGEPTAATFPAIVGSVGIEAAVCADGLAGVNAGQTSFAEATPTALNSLDITSLLRTPPPAADYPNWKGPYLSNELPGDPWGSVYVINVIPLFCGETVTAEEPAGELGFAWILSGGPNRALQTPFTASRIAEDSDDTGVSMNKRLVQGGS